MQKRKKEFLNSLFIAVGVGLLLSLLLFASFLSQFQYKLADALYGGKQPLQNIVIIGIDDKSLQEIGRWPWEREVFVNSLSKLGNAAVVGIDVAFFERYDEKIDEELAEVVRKNNNVVMPVEYMKFELAEGGLYGRNLMVPVGNLSIRARGLGYIHVITDNDGVTRAINMDVKGEFDSFAFEVYNVIFGKKPDVRKARFLINFIGKPGTFKSYSFTDLVNGRIDLKEFEKRIVLIGATSPDMHDDYFVPTSKGKAMAGVEIHANTIQQLITKDYLQNISTWLNIIIIFLVALFVAVLLYRFNIIISSLLIIAGLFGYIYLGIVLFDRFNLIVNFIYPVLSALVTYICVVLYYYFFEKKAKQQVLGAFSKYVSPVLVEEIVKDPSKLKLGGVRREITVMFSDIRGFTTMSERMSAERLVNLLNEYLTEMTNIILKNRGLVDKYMGDAIMAFWNAPLDEKEHAELACLTALDMNKRLIELRRHWESHGVPLLRIGIGLNTGEAVIGNMGSYDRFDYTAMGDTVNLGSRLEGLTKEYGVSIIIAESTYEKVRNLFVCRELDLVTVKGKREPVKIYELVGKKEDVSQDKLMFIAVFDDAVALYRKQRWKDAVKMFEKAHDIEKDHACTVFMERCRYFERNSPGKGWGMVWVMETK